MTNLNSAELNTLINKINANTNTQGEQTMSEVNNVNNELETNWQHIIDGLKIWAFWVGISGYAGFITSGGNGMNIYASEVTRGSYQDGSFYPGHAKLAGLKFMLQASYPVTLIAFVASPLVANLFPRTIATFINGVLGIKEVDFYDRKAQLAFVMKDAKESLVRDYAGVYIAPNQSLTFKGQDIADNDSEVAVVFSDVNPLVISEGEALNTEIRTIKCSFRTKAIVVDYNYK
ncbi:hypothetical protein C7B62_22395 [Pleurocapsa sp. CCALA 161]|uniref:hypothetical protein n=1 Tax=Pleurocapsa sp. CCALA 161 TaxID=2107688 RepID=UPI000D04EA27|nr:hypothetical protein [Pleurocapsa sp. CCALA 161]PSB06592.1 hypothetical protein C7B62_22395 [Pleurocapsa sp. CCALA 161]